MARTSVEHGHCQAIATRYHGPTNARGARVSATAQAGRIYVSWDYALGMDENHDAAARAFVAKWGWDGRWIGGGSPDGRGNVYTCVRGSRR
jgi:hypothetical protein